MPVSLKVENGALANTTWSIGSGDKVRVGRSVQPGLAISTDTALSRIHFEVHHDGTTCWLRDLGSSNGTRVNGNAVVNTALKHGDQVTAGYTTFSFSINTDSPAALPLATGFERLLSPMRHELQPLYVILDTANEPSILKHIVESGQPYFWLFEGDTAVRLVHFAPYLVPLPPASPLIEILLQQGWGKNWGVFLSSTAPTADIVASLRRLLVTTLPDGSNALLRFYDPRILRTLLSTSTEAQLRLLFGVNDYYILESEDPDVALGFTLASTGLRKTELSLSGKQPPSSTVTAPAAALRSADLMRLDSFTLGQGQVTQLGAVEQDGFQALVRAELRVLYPEVFSASGERDMESFVHHGCTRASRYGLRSPSDVRDYLLLMVRLGFNFDIDLPWAVQLLQMRLSPFEKLRRLRAHDQKRSPQRVLLRTG